MPRRPSWQIYFGRGPQREGSVGVSRLIRVFVYLVCLVALVVMRPLVVLAQEAIEADRFVDAVGVNIHLHYDGTPYRTQFDTIKQRLRELNVRHVRDGLIDTAWQGYYDRLNELGDMGIK